MIWFLQAISYRNRYWHTAELCSRLSFLFDSGFGIVCKSFHVVLYGSSYHPMPALVSILSASSGMQRYVVQREVLSLDDASCKGPVYFRACSHVTVGFLGRYETIFKYYTMQLNNTHIFWVKKFHSFRFTPNQTAKDIFKDFSKHRKFFQQFIWYKGVQSHSVWHPCFGFVCSLFQSEKEIIAQEQIWNNFVWKGYEAMLIYWKQRIVAYFACWI